MVHSIIGQCQFCSSSFSWNELALITPLSSPLVNINGKYKYNGKYKILQELASPLLEATVKYKYKR